MNAIKCIVGPDNVLLSSSADFEIAVYQFTCVNITNRDLDAIA